LPDTRPPGIPVFLIHELRRTIYFSIAAYSLYLFAVTSFMEY
jgi:hypothetical protein